MARRSGTGETVEYQVAVLSRNLSDDLSDVPMGFGKIEHLRAKYIVQYARAF
jgi:hypothetical protein